MAADGRNRDCRHCNAETHDRECAVRRSRQLCQELLAYGDRFFYIPGTDICLNPATNDARVQTPASTWRYRIPNNPRRWVSDPHDACHDGNLVKFGDITNAGLTLNAHDRYETTTHYRLKPGRYVQSVLYKGGFTGPGVGLGNFCLFYHVNDPTLGPLYSFPLGCIDTAAQANLPETLVYSPDLPIPPATFNLGDILGANGDLWSVPQPLQSQIQGTLSIWLCLQDAPGSGSGHSDDRGDDHR
jgi:hypothetical protein